VMTQVVRETPKLMESAVSQTPQKIENLEGESPLLLPASGPGNEEVAKEEPAKTPITKDGPKIKMAPTVKDDGKFFTKEGVEAANKKIRTIYEKYKKDVIVETIPALTAEQEKKLKEDGDAKFFAKLTNDHAKEIGLNGVYLLVCNKPKYVRIHMDPETQKKLFTASNRTATVGKIVARFKEDEFDAGLLDGLKEIESILEANSKDTTKTPPKGDKR
jgi:uncharacterized membrane protein YgcG